MKYLTGSKMGKLKILSVNAKKKLETNHTYYDCLCDCGNEVVLSHNTVQSGNTKSCGCLRRTRMLGHKFKNTHEMTKTRQYRTWISMKTRCYKKMDYHYKNWGARGITIPEKWNKFEGFWEDMKDGYRDDLTIDRIDNDKPYSKDNCRWVSNKEQQNNRRNNVKITICNETLNLAQWGERFNIDSRKVKYWSKKGLRDEELIKKITLLKH